MAGGLTDSLGDGNSGGQSLVDEQDVESKQKHGMGVLGPRRSTELIDKLLDGTGCSQTQTWERRLRSIKNYGDMTHHGHAQKYCRSIKIRCGLVFGDIIPLLTLRDRMYPVNACRTPIPIGGSTEAAQKTRLNST
ncbi:hypothetical protein HPP92_028839 [Vanilla planifolia]|uniref:Uncharacterized protein n=1 Tax=Vanilla planifolia TaxID=51239 RepID=A0A835P9F9_VANPL|nr:hypothetical protein HPP92_028839 [Vanilla planifolia]KAG0446434.1 hypothetical protein HPP92_028828 [Vanilla planifolia]